MNLRISRPLPKRLPPDIKHHSTRAPQDHQAHIEHDGLEKPILLNPARDEITQPVSPQVLIDRHRHEQHPGHRPIAVDGICADDGRQCGDLDTGTGVSDDYDGLMKECVRFS